MLDYICMRVLIGTFLLSFSISQSLAKEIPLNNKNIRFFNSDIELSKVLINIFENYQLSSFSKNEFKKYSYKFSKNSRLADFKPSLEILKNINHYKSKSKIISQCKKINDLDKSFSNFKTRISIYCFNKAFSYKMKKNLFHNLSSATPLARKNSKVRYKISKYLQKTKVATVKTKSSKNKNGSLNFIKQIKLIRKLSHKTSESNFTFVKEVKTLLQMLDDKDHLENSENVKHMIYLVKTLNRHDKEKESRKFSKFMIENSNTKQDTFLFQLLWTYVSRNQYKDAFKNVIKKYGLQHNYKTFDNAKLKFWLAHSLEVNNVNGGAEIYQDIVDKSPLSFYALLSYNRIKNNEIDVTLINSKSDINSDFKFNLSQKSKDQLQLIRALIVNNSIFLLSDEVSNFIGENSTKDKSHNKKLYISLAKFMQSNGNYLESFKIVYRGINKKFISVNEDVLKLLYPRPYMDIISKQNKEFDSYLALSLMRQESSFNNFANSSVGARGLMQLMPNTAKGLKKSIKVKDLYNPKTNIKLGVKYLNGLNKRFDKNFVHMLSAYNAGERNVKRWKKNYFISDSLLKNIENIPFNETRKYVKLIFRNIFYYNYLDKLEGRKPATDTNRLFEKYLQVKR